MRGALASVFKAFVYAAYALVVAFIILAWHTL